MVKTTTGVAVVEVAVVAVTVEQGMTATQVSPGKEDSTGKDGQNVWQQTQSSLSKYC